MANAKCVIAPPTTLSPRAVYDACKKAATTTATSVHQGWTSTRRHGVGRLTLWRTKTRITEDTVTEYEVRNHFELSDIPLTVEMNNDLFCLAGSRAEITDALSRTLQTTPQLNYLQGTLPRIAISRIKGQFIVAIGAYDISLAGWKRDGTSGRTTYVKNGKATTVEGFDWHELSAGTCGIPSGSRDFSIHAGQLSPALEMYASHKGYLT